MSRQSFNGIWNLGLRHVGIVGLTPHMMRHVGSTLYLAVNPGDYDVVADVLRNSRRTVEQFYHRGEGRAATRIFSETLTEINASAGELIGRRAA